MARGFAGQLRHHASSVKIGLQARIPIQFLKGSSNVIMVYHAVGGPNETFFGNIPLQRFREDLLFFKEHFEVVDLPEIFPIEGDTRKLSITFDDGLKSFYENVVPILQEQRVPATIFVNPGFIGDANRDRLIDTHNIDYGGNITMSKAELKEVNRSSLVTIGNHTLYHERLPDCSDTYQRETILGAQQALEELINEDVTRFCYPGGAYNETTLEIVRESHGLATTTEQSVIYGSEQPWTLPRISGHLTPRKMKADLTHWPFPIWK